MRPSIRPERPALVLSAIISTIRLRPALVADKSATFCRYIGRKMLRPMIELQPNECAPKQQRAFALPRMSIGISGSGAVISRHTKPDPTTAASANSRRIAGDAHE